MSRFTDLEPYTNYNVTFYIKDSKSNKTYASMKYVNTTTGEGGKTFILFRMSWNVLKDFI